jgi:hypothetical protein
MTERHSPAEAKLVFARMAELQLARERVTVGMTREELVRIAVDAGLDAELLDQALAEIRASRVEYRVEETLTKTVVSCELARPLGEDEHVELSNRLAHAYGVHGRWEALPTGKVWRAASLELTIRRTLGGDLLRVEARRRWPAFALVLGVPAASGALALTVEILFAWKSRIDLIVWAVFLAALSIGWALVWVAGKQGSTSIGERLVALLEQTVRRLPSEAPNTPRALPEERG